MTASRGEIPNDTVRAIAPGATVSGGVTWRDLIYLKQNVTVGVNDNLKILPGTVVVFRDTSAADVSLLSYGTFSARGKKDTVITFKPSATSPGRSSWGSIIFYSGSADTIEYAVIDHAQIGLGSLSSTAVLRNDTLRNNYYGIYLDSCTPTVYHNYVTSSGNAGIYVTNASAGRLARNTLTGNGYGVRCYSSGSPDLDSNTISGNSGYGISCDSYSSPHLGIRGYYWSAGYNLIKDNGGDGLSAAYWSQPWLGNYIYGGYNSIHGQTRGVSAYYGSSVMAQNNYWGSPMGQIYCDGSSSIDTTLSRGADPVPTPFAKTTGDPLAGAQTPLDSAFVLEMTGQTEDAAVLYRRIVTSDGDRNARTRALVAVSDLYQRTGKTGFLELLDDSLASAFSGKEELQIAATGLASFWLERAGQADEALNRLQGLMGAHPGRPDVLKFARLRQAELYAHRLGQKEKALELQKLLASERQGSPDAAVDGLPVLIDYWVRLYEARAGGDLKKEPTTSRSEIPAEFALSEAYPNPFNPSTHFQLSLPKAALVRLIIYDILGREVARLLDGGLEAGRHEIVWHGRSHAGQMASSGTYLGRLEVRDPLGKAVYTRTAKLLLVK